MRKNGNLADGFDAVVCDLCFDDVDDALLDNALATGRAGKPTIFIHCAVHSFRNSKKVHEWEDYIGLRSKFHDKFGPFETTRMDASSPILQGFPDLWQTRGDERPHAHRCLGSHVWSSAGIRNNARSRQDHGALAGIPTIAGQCAVMGLRS